MDYGGWTKNVLEIVDVGKVNPRMGDQAVFNNLFYKVRRVLKLVTSTISIFRRKSLVSDDYIW